MGCLAATRASNCYKYGFITDHKWIPPSAGYATILAPALLLAPRYFAGELRFGDISQVRSTDEREGKT